MTFWEALMQGTQIVVVVGGVIGLLVWSFEAWFGGWWERIANVAAWILLVSVVVWLAGWPGSPA